MCWTVLLYQSRGLKQTKINWGNFINTSNHVQQCFRLWLLAVYHVYGIVTTQDILYRDGVLATYCMYCHCQPPLLLILLKPPVKSDLLNSTLQVFKFKYLLLLSSFHLIHSISISKRCHKKAVWDHDIQLG